MEIIYGEYPPNYKDIAAAFDIEDRDGIVFTYGNKLYIPSGRKPDAQLLRHEETHAREQLEIGIEEWWDRYLVDTGFRFMQELKAYREQYRAMATLPFERRLSYLDHIATDLAGPIYGNLLTKEEAISEITRGIILKRSGSTSSKRKDRKRQRNNRKKARR